jgi:hypothetical protein
VVKKGASFLGGGGRQARTGKEACNCNCNAGRRAALAAALSIDPHQPMQKERARARVLMKSESYRRAAMKRTHAV